jgi:hypothetical protein
MSYQHLSTLRLRLRLSACQHFSKSFRGLAKSVVPDCRWWRCLVRGWARPELKKLNC